MSGNLSKNNRVEHPSYYQRQDGNGIECIDLIRHYVCDIANAIKYCWRAGLKSEEGMTDKEKEIEDLQKALFYIADYKKLVKINTRINYYVTDPFFSNIDIDKITLSYDVSVGTAIAQLSRVGRIYDGQVIADGYEGARLGVAEECINARINELKKKKQ